MSTRISILAFMAAALLALPGTAGAAKKDDIVVTPNPVAVSSSYHVAICGVKASTVIVVDTNGPSDASGMPFFTRREYTADSQGCANYNDVSGSVPGQYGITAQQARGSNLAFLGWAPLNVR